MAGRTPKEVLLYGTQSHGSIVTGTGIRYGSIAYFGFGNCMHDNRNGRSKTNQYALEIEIGADDWFLSRSSVQLLDSNFSSIDKARVIWKDALIGRKLLDLHINGDTAEFTFEDGLALKSVISEDPASGFLFSYQERDSGGWETTDGLAMVTD